MSSSLAPRDRLKSLREKGVLSLEEYLAELEQLSKYEPNELMRSPANGVCRVGIDCAVGSGNFPEISWK